MTRFKTIALISAAAAMPLGACAQNYAVEGAAVGAAAGAVLGATTNVDSSTAIAAGAAIGGGVGYFIDKNDRCDGYDRNGRLDDDCRGKPGYPRR